MDTGLALVIGAGAVAVLTVFVLRSRAPAALSISLMTAASAALAYGGMLLRQDPSTAEVALAVAAMAILGPAHVRIVLGPYGPRS